MNINTRYLESSQGANSFSAPERRGTTERPRSGSTHKADAAALARMEAELNREQASFDADKHRSVHEYILNTYRLIQRMFLKGLKRELGNHH